MIQFENLTKSFRVRGHRHIVIDDLTMELPQNRSMALLGRNGAGKSTLMQLISGSLRPDHGRILTNGTVSWPVGFGGSFHRELTGAQNIRFVARIYGVDTEALVRFVEAFAELGDHFNMPVKGYSSGMKSRLTFGASMGIQFDTYLIDEVTAVGDAAFRAKSRAVFHTRLENSSAIMVSHSNSQLRQFCDCGLVLEGGRAVFFDDLEDALDAHAQNMRQSGQAGSKRAGRVGRKTQPRKSTPPSEEAVL